KKGGIVTGPLVRAAPKNAAEKRALRRKVLSRDHAVGNLVARDGKAVLIYCFLAHGSDPRAVGQNIRTVVARYAPADKTYWGGGPFIAAHIYDSTRADMRRLTPWAVLAMVIVMMIAFRDIRGTCLALLSTGFGIVVSLGLMAAFGVRINLALGSMPIILFAVGSAYGIHVLARYYKLAQTRDVEQAVIESLETVGPTVLAAGLTTVASLLSFMTMDLAPMRSFGLFTAIGVLATLILALTFVPAVITLLRFRGRKVPGEAAGLRVLEVIVAFARKRRMGVSAALGVLCAVGLVLAFNVDSRIELSNLFAHDSEPARAERFMRARFGGSTFLQVHVVGDLRRPEVLREVRRIGDKIRVMPGVASVTHVATALAIANEAMEGQRRVPDSPDKVKLLLALLSGDPSVGQLMSKDRREALIQVKLRESNADAQEKLLARVEALARRDSRAIEIVDVRTSRHKARRIRLVTTRLASLWQDADKPLSDDQRNSLFVSLAMLPRGKPDKARLVAALTRFLLSEENTVKIDDAAKARALADKIVALGGPRGGV
ncbi:MAG: MMPL family transporter, partial [Myxococcales bacterium]|nr:MMPL family transporter [Myxococcales bacterium]